MMLEVARSRRPPLPEIVLWIAASRSPSESQTSECSDLLSRSRATFVIVAQRQPGKLRTDIRVMLPWRASKPDVGIPNGTTSGAIRNVDPTEPKSSVNGHTASNAPDPIRTRKLSDARPGQYWGGGPPGKPFGCR